MNYVEQALAELTAGKPVSVPATEPYGCSVKYQESPRARHPAGRRPVAAAGSPPAESE